MTLLTRFRGGVLPTYLLAVTVTGLIASTAFVGHRNRSFREREIARAERSAAAFASGKTPTADLLAGGLITTKRNRKYPYLAERFLQDGRRLGDPEHRFEGDKRLYDAAGEAENRGRFERVLDDGKHAIVAIPTESGVAVAITRVPTGPEPFPWLVFLGLLAMGGVAAAAGGLIGGPARTAGLAAGASSPAIPAYLWGGTTAALIVIVVAAAFAFADRRRALARLREGFYRHRVAASFIAPTTMSMAVLVIAPFLFGLVLGFYNHSAGTWTFAGLDNFTDILTGDGRPLTDPLNFWFTLGVTVLWTTVNVVLHVGIGIAVALTLSRHWVSGKAIFRLALILPWAIPNYITALVWHGMFQAEYGALNGLIGLLGLEGVSWFANFSTSFFANVCTNTWLGFPFMMVVALGAIESIPSSLYEAAEVDGATPWQRFWHITAPHLRPAMGPAMVLGAIWTFNMFNVIYLVSDGQPGGSTDILVTEAYRWAFERGERYGLAAAYATLIFTVLLLWTVFGTRLLRQEKSQ